MRADFPADRLVEGGEGRQEAGRLPVIKPSGNFLARTFRPDYNDRMNVIHGYCFAEHSMIISRKSGWSLLGLR